MGVRLKQLTQGTQMKITTQDFRAAKAAAKKVIADTSLAHHKAIDVLAERCPTASQELINDMAWQCVMAAR